MDAAQIISQIESLLGQLKSAVAAKAPVLDDEEHEIAASQEDSVDLSGLLARSRT